MYIDIVSIIDASKIPQMVLLLGFRRCLQFLKERWEIAKEKWILQGKRNFHEAERARIAGEAREFRKNVDEIRQIREKEHRQYSEKRVFQTLGKAKDKLYVKTSIIHVCTLIKTTKL